MGLPTMPVQNAEIAVMFEQAAELLEIQGENQFRVRAYRRAARVIEGLPQSVRSLLSAGRDLSELPGIGKDLAGKIADIVESGHFELLDTLKKQLPGELGDMAALPGLGPKRAKLLYDKLKVRTLDDLRRVLKTGRLRELKGFGPLIARKLSEALEKPGRRSGSSSRSRRPKPRIWWAFSAMAGASWLPAAIGGGATRSAISTCW
jgi:DNA polymerase (family X)